MESAELLMEVVVMRLSGWVGAKETIKLSMEGCTGWLGPADNGERKAGEGCWLEGHQWWGVHMVLYALPVEAASKGGAASAEPVPGAAVVASVGSEHAEVSAEGAGAPAAVRASCWPGSVGDKSQKVNQFPCVKASEPVGMSPAG